MAIQGVPVDTIDIRIPSAAPSVPSVSVAHVQPPVVLAGTAAACAVVRQTAEHTSEETEQSSAAFVDTSTVQLLVDQMRRTGARMQAFIDPASVNRSWIRRGRVFWLQQRRPVSSDDATVVGAAAEDDSCHQRAYQSDMDRQPADSSLLGSALSYDAANPMQLRFGFRRARYTIRHDAPLRETGSQLASPQPTVATSRGRQAKLIVDVSDQTPCDSEGGDTWEGEADRAKGAASTQNERLIALAEAWLARGTSE